MLSTAHRDPDGGTPDEAGRPRPRSARRIKIRSNAWQATAQLWDAGIVGPAQTCDVLELALAVTLETPILERPRFGFFRM
ncbi:hypothetical protein [Sphingomonas mollis]|uniref:Uncharacterized protein n=1 Tax=Sphingomonas mollis TaxID=2795726 RepID=A0ABS0XRQ4_9SPHN|nr:hypothetical protein [Sphingomonas sp. BT553]MBJ6122737.1 hypothetical protein [Sphingomonas sp. BT553]